MTQPQFSLALVTGASSGIGAGICRLLAHQGIPLIITGRDKQRLNHLAEELRALVPVETVIADIANAGERKLLVELVHERAPDLVINNAGFGLYGPALTFETKESLDVVDVNVSALLELTLESARTLFTAKRKGTVLNISSSSDLIVFPGFAVYAASKAFVTQFSRSLDEEMKPHGIRILASCPGVVATGFRKRASGGAESDSKTKSTSMSVPFAAEQIWHQILKGKQVHGFDWKTRLGVFLARFIIPQKYLSKFLLKKIQSFHPVREWIPINNPVHKNHNA